MISPLYGQLSPLRIPTKVRQVSADADANAYLLAVEAADGQQLEQGVVDAVETFVLGCKSDGIWSAIKASCILAGARTLSGALKPLVGASPTNFNFVTADYNRKTGLKGNGTSKYLNSNRNNNADPQNSKHVSVWRTQGETRNSTRYDLGTPNGTGMTQLATTSSNRYWRSNGADNQVGDVTSLTGLWAHSRSTATTFSRFYQSAIADATGASQVPFNATIQIFARGGTNFSDSRISFYSIGEALDLSLLNNRVSTLMTDLSAAI